MMLLAATDWYAFFFLLFALLACVFAAAVLFTSNIVRMAFYLTLSLGATAGLFFLAGAEFIGAMQLMIYVGGTLVLLIFGVMLTAQAPFLSLRTRSGEWIVSLIGGQRIAVAAAGHGLWRAAVACSRGGGADCLWPKLRPPRPSVRDWPVCASIGLNVAPDETAVGDTNTLSGYLLPFVIISIHCWWCWWVRPTWRAPRCGGGRRRPAGGTGKVDVACLPCWHKLPSRITWPSGRCCLSPACCAWPPSAMHWEC